MARHLLLRKNILFIVIIVIVVGLSILSGRIWGGKPEQSQGPGELVIEKEMTVGRFGQANALPDKVLKEIFDLKTKADLERALSEYGTTDQVISMVKKKLALTAEHESKNWIKIPVKFFLWFIFLSMVFIFSKKREVTSGVRNGLLFAAVLIFGVIMGSDPSPMGTVKDAIHLYGTARVIFLPRIIALTVFLAIVFFANKYICAWGCQIGTLQDLIFRINQADGQKAVMGRQIKIPFVLTNSVRFIFFCVFTFFAFSLGTDIIETVDPFKIYNPTHLGLTGGVFIGMLLLASLFIYRPWCHLFCPFGLVGWLVEKISLVRISVNYETCIACQRCATACPSTVMGAILRRDKKTIPDCFACYTCREVCPTNSIQFSTRKRTLPPAGHFDKKRRTEDSLERPIRIKVRQESLEKERL
jgi:Fe-S-cluster-containing hydrogenase component 2